MKKSLRILGILMIILVGIQNSLAAKAEGIIDELTDQEKRNNSFVQYVKKLESEKGKLLRQWSVEELSLISQKEKELDADVLDETYLLPQEGMISEEEAVDIAKKCVSSAFKKNGEDLTVFQASVLQFKEDQNIYWYISFIEGGYCLLTQEGNVTENIEHSKLTPVEQYKQAGAKLTIELAIEQYGEHRIYLWPAETLAELDKYDLSDKANLDYEDTKQLAIEALESTTGMPINDNWQVYVMYMAGGSWEILVFDEMEYLFAQIYIDDITQEVRAIYVEANG